MLLHRGYCQALCAIQPVSPQERLYCPTHVPLISAPVFSFLQLFCVAAGTHPVTSHPSVTRLLPIGRLRPSNGA